MDGELSQRAADMIVAKIEAQIVSGELANNTPLPAERSLMEEFGTSRTVVREAISTLSNRGLIESRPRFRPVVRKPDYETVLSTTSSVVRHLLNDPGSVQNLFNSRLFVERGLVRDAAINATKDDIRDLKDALQANESAINHSEAFFESDIRFHRVFYTISKNPIFSALHEGYVSWLSPQWRLMLGEADRNMINYRAHNVIFDAILERDPEAAELALEHHLLNAWDQVKGTFAVDIADH